MHDIFEKPPWQLDPIGWQPPGVGFDLLSLFRTWRKASGREARTTCDVGAREDVQRAIADYCAAQPNANTIQICSTSPAIRWSSPTRPTAPPYLPQLDPRPCMIYPFIRLYG